MPCPTRKRRSQSLYLIWTMLLAAFVGTNTMPARQVMQIGASDAVVNVDSATLEKLLLSRRPRNADPRPPVAMPTYNNKASSTFGIPSTDVLNFHIPLTGQRQSSLSRLSMRLNGSRGESTRRGTNLSEHHGVNRIVQFYSKTGYHLQILPDGRVNGTLEENSPYAAFYRLPVGDAGQVKLETVKTCLFLCMNKRGVLYGSPDFTDDCKFQEYMENNSYNTYSSVKHSTRRRTSYVALTGKGVAKRVRVAAAMAAVDDPRHHALHAVKTKSSNTFFMVRNAGDGLDARQVRQNRDATSACERTEPLFVPSADDANNKCANNEKCKNKGRNNNRGGGNNNKRRRQQRERRRNNNNNRKKNRREGRFAISDGGPESQSLTLDSEPVSGLELQSSEAFNSSDVSSETDFPSNNNSQEGDTGSSIEDNN